jgi:hypothetical protein
MVFDKAAGKGSADDTLLFSDLWGRTYGVRGGTYTATRACDVADVTIRALKDKIVANVTTIDSGEVHNDAYVDQYICSINSIAYKPGEMSMTAMKQLYDTIVTGKLLVSLFSSRLKDAGKVRESISMAGVAADCTAKFLDNMMRMTQAACYNGARDRDQRFMDRLAQSVDALGQAMAMAIIPGGNALTVSSQYFQVTATSSRKVDPGAQGALALRTNDVIGAVAQSLASEPPLFSYSVDLAPTCVGLQGWACAKDVTNTDVLRVSSYFFTRATYVEGGTDYINPLPRTAYTDPYVFGGLAGITATYINATGFDAQLAKISSTSVVADLVKDIQAGIRAHQLWMERFLYASRLPLSAQSLDFINFALPTGFDDVAKYQSGVRYWPLGTDLVGDVAEFALIPRNWTKEGIVDKGSNVLSARLTASAANLYYARVIAPYVEDRVYLPPPPFEFVPPPPSPPLNPPPPPMEVQYVRGDLDPALVVAPIVAGMALCAYLMHVYTKRRRDMQNIHIDLDDEIEYDPADDDVESDEYESESDEDDSDSEDDGDGDEYNDGAPQQVDVVDRSGYEPRDAPRAGGSGSGGNNQRLPEPEPPKQRGLFGGVFRGGSSRKQRYEVESTNPPLASSGGGAGPSSLDTPMLDDDGGREDDHGQRL